MPNARELTRMFKDIQELIPAAAGAIVALVTVIGLLIPGIQGDLSSKGNANNAGTTSSQKENSNNNGGATNPQVPSKPQLSGVNYLTDFGTAGPGDAARVGAVTVSGKTYKKSILATNRDTRKGVSPSSDIWFFAPETEGTLKLKAGWADNVPNSGGVGRITISRWRQPLDEFYVKPGEVVERTIDVPSGIQLIIHFLVLEREPGPNESLRDQAKIEHLPSNGLAVLDPVWE